MEALKRIRMIRNFLRRPLIRLIRGDPLFGFFLGMLGLMLVSLALFIPKIWVVSPSGVTPAIRVSGLDLAQAWSLKRTAKENMRAGDYDKASFAWLAACANNRADPKLFRGFLRNFINGKSSAKQTEIAIHSSFWLLKLTSTNLSDLELTSEVLADCGAVNLLFRLLEPRKHQLSTELEARYLKVLFDCRKMNDFAAFWNLGSERHALDAELRLYSAAALAGWGESKKTTAAFAELDDALELPELGLLACRLQMAASAQRNDLDRYRMALGKLKNSEADSLLDHIGFWRLLVNAGRKSEALNMVNEMPAQPRNARETLSIAKFLWDIGFREDAINVLAQSQLPSDSAQEFWTFYADLLITAKRWEDLKRVALLMRRQSSIRNRFTALSYYLEGRAELALKRQFSATAAFQRMLDWPFNNPELWIRIGNQLLQFNRPKLTVKILTALRTPPSQDPNYWSLLFDAASRIRDTDRMLEAAAQWHKLQPENLEAMQNYAAALMLNKTNPDLAIRLTWLLKSRLPSSTTASLNHATALRLNERHLEADAVLSKLDPNQLTEREAAAYHLNRFSLALQSDRNEEAQIRGKMIDQRHLYTPQRDWLADRLREVSENMN